MLRRARSSRARPRRARRPTAPARGAAAPSFTPTVALAPCSDLQAHDLGSQRRHRALPPRQATDDRTESELPKYAWVAADSSRAWTTSPTGRAPRRTYTGSATPPVPPAMRSTHRTRRHGSASMTRQNSNTGTLDATTKGALHYLPSRQRPGSDGRTQRGDLEGAVRRHHPQPPRRTPTRSSPSQRRSPRRSMCTATGASCSPPPPTPASPGPRPRRARSPIFSRFASTTMTGTNPDGSSHYSDPGVPWVNYFNGGDARPRLPARLLRHAAVQRLRRAADSNRRRPSTGCFSSGTLS